MITAPCFEHLLCAGYVNLSYIECLLNALCIHLSELAIPFQKGDLIVPFSEARKGQVSRKGSLSWEGRKLGLEARLQGRVVPKVVSGNSSALSS